MAKSKKDKDKKGKSGAGKRQPSPASGVQVAEHKEKMSNKEYEAELFKLHAELVKLQEWAKVKGTRAIVVFEGRDAAGKGGVIKRITERVSPRVFRVAALPAPSEREKTQLYMQRYFNHFPAAGEIVLFDRSWYNRAGVERVMNFCSEEEYRRFLHYCPIFEKAMADGGVILIKYWFDVSMEEQERRFRSRIDDPRKLWKLSPMDLESHRRWYDYSRARDDMLAVTDTEEAPWYVVPSNDKKRARLNCISHMLSMIPYEEMPREKVKLPKRNTSDAYDDSATMVGRRVIPQLF